jgi:hypothetical protein
LVLVGKERREGARRDRCAAVSSNLDQLNVKNGGKGQRSPREEENRAPRSNRKNLVAAFVRLFVCNCIKSIADPCFFACVGDSPLPLADCLPSVQTVCRVRAACARQPTATDSLPINEAQLHSHDDAEPQQLLLLPRIWPRSVRHLLLPRRAAASLNKQPAAADAALPPAQQGCEAEPATWLRTNPPTHAGQASGSVPPSSPPQSPCLSGH